MANAFTINGTTASLAPYSCRWREFALGTDHNGRTIYSGYREIDLAFDSGSISFGRQWLQAASSGSANIDVLDKFGLNYVSLSGIVMIINEFPAVESINFTPFSITVTKA